MGMVLPKKELGEFYSYINFKLAYNTIFKWTHIY
jgi:hypothetical protein